MNSINQVFVSSELSIVAVHISLQFLCYDSQFKSYKQFLMMMTPVWRMLQMPDIHHPSPSPDRQGSVCVWSCSHVLCLCLASWGSCQPIRGQEGDSLTNQRPGQCWPWHGCCDVWRNEGWGGDSVPVSGMEYKIQILHWIVQEGCRQRTVVRWGKLCGKDAEGGPHLSTPGETSNWAWNLFRLFKIVLAGLHTPNAYWDHFLYIQNILRNWIAMRMFKIKGKN